MSGLEKREERENAVEMRREEIAIHSLVVWSVPELSQFIGERVPESHVNGTFS